MAACTAQEKSLRPNCSTPGPGRRHPAATGYELPVRPGRGQIALVNTGNRCAPCADVGSATFVPRARMAVLAARPRRSGILTRDDRRGISSLLEFAHRMVPALAGFPGEKPCGPPGRQRLTTRPCTLPLPNWAHSWPRAIFVRIQLSPGTGDLQGLAAGPKPAISLNRCGPLVCSRIGTLWISGVSSIQYNLDRHGFSGSFRVLVRVNAAGSC